MSQFVFPDNTVLCNFAVVDRLSLLRDWLRGRGRWTEAVSSEVQRSAEYLPSLLSLGEEDGWLGEPIVIAGQSAIEAVERKRRIVFGGLPTEPRKHLGEAQTCYLISEVAEFTGAWWITDDKDAYEHAVHLGIGAYRTIDVVRHIVAEGDFGAREAFALMQKMASRDRWLVMPDSPTDLC